MLTHHGHSAPRCAVAGASSRSATTRFRRTSSTAPFWTPSCTTCRASASNELPWFGWRPSRMRTWWPRSSSS
eukprot:10618539-Prorocentrum_lima.AAC.1